MRRSVNSRPATEKGVRMKKKKTLLGSHTVCFVKSIYLYLSVSRWPLRVCIRGATRIEFKILLMFSLVIPLAISHHLEMVDNDLETVKLIPSAIASCSPLGL